VVLFDEIEKAHPDVFNALLQILDDGRLTDGHGRVVDFRNTVIVMTSNVGSQHLRELAGMSAATVEERVMEALRRTFRPEFLNRVDDILVFRRLGRPELEEIVDIQLRRFRQRLGERGLTLELSPAARRFLCDQGFDPEYGARPLKRAVQRYLTDPLARRIIGGEFRSGSKVLAEVAGEELSFGS
jgi:ATP-dependent Clp protease ATP-binding subunit ClpB